MTTMGDPVPTTRRPVSVTAIGWLFIAAGVAGFAYHALEFDLQTGFDYDTAWVLVVRILAIVAGALTLRGENWGRWLALAWVGYHVYLSTLHSVSETVTHLVVLAVCAAALLYPGATAFFRSQELRPPTTGP
jgi:hypothetical protein